MARNGLIALAVALVVAYFLYEPVVDRFFTDTSLRVSEAPEFLTQDDDPVQIRTNRLELTFSPYGARLTSAHLRNFETDQDEPLELISGLLKSRGGIRLEVPSVLEDLDDRLYRYERKGEGVAFIQELPKGLEIQKSYQPEGDYALLLKLRLTNVGAERLDFPDGYRITPFFGIRPGDEARSKKTRLVWMNHSEDHVMREQAKKVKEPVHSEGALAWVGIHNRYFAQILVPKDKKHEASFHTLGEWQAYPVLNADAFALDPGQSYESAYLLYLGPMLEDELKQYDAGLEKIVDYGTFEFLGKGVFWLLRWIHGYASNYGLCMILLALALRVILFPITQYNLKSLREMPRILQEIYDIEEEEKDRPEIVEERIRPLRKKQVRSMVGSFLPLAVQIPIFLALYQVLNASIELRQAEFIFWITDLSVRDPFFVLPILMGLVMIVQQRLTAANPSSDKTWIWMPMGFALLFAFFPAGLVLFWFADSLFSVIQLSWISLKA